MESSRGQSMVEFALVAPLAFLILVVLFDFMRASAISNTVADAARQGARQAVANAYPTDDPFGASNGQPCQGTSFTSGASGRGCLTDTRIAATVVQDLGSTISGSTLFSNTTAAACPLPAPGQASICVAPSETGAAGSYSDCAAARTALGHDPLPGDLGARQPEWTSPRYKGCFLVEVTVVVRYAPMTPLAGSLFPAVMRLAASTSTVAEY